MIFDHEKLVIACPETFIGHKDWREDERGNLIPIPGLRGVCAKHGLVILDDYMILANTLKGGFGPLKPYVGLRLELQCIGVFGYDEAEAYCIGQGIEGGVRSRTGENLVVLPPFTGEIDIFHIKGEAVIYGTGNYTVASYNFPGVKELSGSKETNEWSYASAC